MAPRLRLDNLASNAALKRAEARYGNGDGVLDDGEADAIARSLATDGTTRTSLGYTRTSLPKDGLDLMSKAALASGDETSSRSAALKLVGGAANPYLADSANGRALEADRLSLRVVRYAKAQDFVPLSLGLIEAAYAKGELDTARDAADSLFLGLDYAPRGAKEIVLQRLEALTKSGLVLRPEHTKAMTDLAAALYPTKPPYAEWFTGTNTTLNAAFYFHSDYSAGFIAELQSLGLVVTKTGATTYEVSGKIDGMPVKGTARVVESYGDDRKMFESMNDPNVKLVFYGGHSNLGGNIGAALESGPAAMNGKKLVALWMCKGKQNLPGVSEKYPDADVITTKVSPPGYSGTPMMRALLKGIAARKDYEAIHADHEPKGDFFYPNQRDQAAYRDRDGDGVVDARDPWFTTDKQPRAVAAARDAILFANTVLGYHLDEGSTAIAETDRDRFTPMGFFDGPASEAVRIEEKDGRFLVRVNSKLQAQSAAALGVITVYELAKYLQKRKGALDADANLRAYLLATELLAYTTGGGDAALRELSKHAGLPALTYDEVKAAIDLTSYVQDASVRKLAAIVAAKGR